MKTILILPAVLLGITLVCSCHKDETTLPTTEKYFPKVKTIIQYHCLSCHSATGSWAGRPISFDTDEEIVAAHASIKASVADPADPGPFGNKRMPQNEVLSAQDVDVIVKWFEKGGRATD